MTKYRNYPEVDPSASFSVIEENIINYWQKYKIFEKSIDSRPSKLSSKNNEFVFYDGPPFANGLPHYGHLLTGFIKDTYARYQTIKGKRVERRFGWDCHGLPAEMGAEKELGISGRTAIINFGIDKFNKYCHSSVMRYANDWEQYVQRQGRWVDLNNSYKTMDLSFMESVLWTFKQLYQKGLIYQAMKVMPYSWACETPLSNFETKLDNSYRERADKAVTVSFVLKDKPKSAPPGFKEYRVLAWTTTPWTLPANLAIAVGKTLDYVAVPSGKICYILGKFAFKNYAGDLQLTTEQSKNYVSFKGKELEYITYKPLFDYFIDVPNAFKILCGDFVTEENGTGLVHIAPGFGEDDQLLCRAHNIELVCPVDNSGKFTKEVSDFQGMNVFDANDKIIIYLKFKNSWIKTEQYLHNYPHCWRTDTPLIYKAVPSWYIKVTDLKERMIQLNQQVNWIPDHVRDGLFGKWLENARDWSISRNRFWGTPIPIWVSDNPNYPRIDVYGSIFEIEKDFGVKVIDLHRPFIDTLTRINPDDPSGKSIMRRVEDVFDCWFESGSMPYAQVHYPFENREWFESHFPADFIVEYAAQTRGWFYTLFVLSTALFDCPPFINCICHGVILDENGQKLSKRLNNYADPLELFKKYGADALRFTMLSSTVTRGQELLIDKNGQMIFDNLRLHLKPLWNAYHFFTIYANADNVSGNCITESENILDIFILSKLRITVENIDKALSEFDSLTACFALSNFLEVLNNWYIRRSRQRFWKSEKDSDKQLAYNSLYTCLTYICRASSPFLPLICEEIYLGLHGNIRDGNLSVHLTNFPDVTGIKIDKNLVEIMDQVIEICSAALHIRSMSNVRIRQPLQSLSIIHLQANKLQQFDHLIKEEVNVKNILYRENVYNYADFKLSLNFPALGKRLPQLVKHIIQDSKLGKWQKLDDGTIEIASVKLLSTEYSLTLEPKLANSIKLPSNDGLVMLDLNVTGELYFEGIARDLIRLIQQARKDAKLDISDNINLTVQACDEILKAVRQHQSLITKQTLSNICTVDFPCYIFSDKINDNVVTLKIAKVKEKSY